LIRILQNSVWDSMQKQTVAFSKNSSNLFFHILTKCNLSCTHCYINKDQHGVDTLDIGTIKKWLKLFANRPVSDKNNPKQALINKNPADKSMVNKAAQTNVIFLGGEPTLHPDLHLAVKEAKSLGFKSITIDTNGYLFNNILDKISCDDIDYFSFSLDGATQTTNDSIRGEGSYDKVMEGIKKAVAKNFSCSMIYTVSEKNFHELELMEDLIKNLGIKRFFIQVIGMRGKSSGSKGNFQVSKENWLKTIPKTAKKIAGHGIVVTYPKVYQCPICEDFPLHSLEIRGNKLIPTQKINEKDLFKLTIPEGCVMNKMIQPQNLSYNKVGEPYHQIACCMLKEEIS
jgi:MoaA/NifB/PqqE/SkfB family radical SAM enzyme